MKKVLIVVNGFIKYSGAERVLTDYLNNQYDNDYSVLVIGSRKENFNFFKDCIKPEKLYFVKCDYKFSRLSRFILMPFDVLKINSNKKLNREIVSLLKSVQPDIVYFNNSLEAALTFDLFKDCKRIIHIHDMIDTFKPAFKRRILSCLHRCDRIITVSNGSKEDMLKNRIDCKKITVVHNFMKLGNPKSDNNEGIYTIGFVGSVIKRKGLDILYNALNMLDKPFKLLVVTNHIDKKYFKRFENNNNFKAEINSCVEAQNMYEQYRKMDLLIVPSRHDPLPTVCLEAIANDILVIGSDVDGIPELVCDDKLLFESGNADSLLRLIEYVFNMPCEILADVRLKQRENLIDNFSFENKNRLINKVIDDL